MTSGSPPATRASQAIEQFFRQEAGRLNGALVRLLGPEHFSLAEDVAQEALLKAYRTWSEGPLPDNPSAWITRVAMNLARDALRHRRMSQAKQDAVVTYLEQTSNRPQGLEEGEDQLRDDSLRLLFVCCHPSIAPDAQVMLALKVLCGFSTAEIARAFLSTEAAIEKQLTRTKHRIEEQGIGFVIPLGAEMAARLDGVLGALYLLFNEGYKASAGERLLREELCQEAIRLTHLLLSHPAGATPRSHALLALMLLNAARFPARVDDRGELLRLDDQDRTKWNQPLIARGLQHLSQSAVGNELTEYHLQAAIAACHCTAPDLRSTDWARILAYYDELERLQPSPIVQLNRAVALAHLQGARAALEELSAIPQLKKLEGHYLYHAVKGELHARLGERSEAAAAYRRALELATVGPEQSHLQRQLALQSS